MPLQHNPALEILDTYNPYILTVRDSSEYNENISIEMRIIQIFMPGFVDPVILPLDGNADFVAGNNIRLSAKDLGLQSASSTEQYKLPDGVYRIIYSINSTSHVEIYHMRTTDVLNLYYKMLSKTSIDVKYPDDEQERKIQILRKLRMYIDASKANVEYSFAFEKGIQLLTNIRRELETFETDWYKIL